MSETNDQRIYDRCIIRVGQLEAENAKLRELIHDMNECIEHSSHNCDGCSLDKCKLYEFNCRIRELGVEV